MRDTNVEGDLVVEHYNNIFKVGTFAVFWWLYSFYKGIYNQEILESLRGNYDEERIATIAVGIDIKKELEAKLNPIYAERSGLLEYSCFSSL